MEKQILIYTMDGCAACQSMKSALERLGVEYTEVRLTNGMTIPPDVRGVPTLAMENNGKRTTICTGWPGKDETFERILISFCVLKKGEKQ